MADPGTSEGNGPRPEDRPEIEDLGQLGILVADLSGYTQVVYQCVEDDIRLQRLALALFRLFRDPASGKPDISVEGYAGDGFLALAHGGTPARTIYDFAIALNQRFREKVRSLMMDLGFRVSISLRTGLHVGRVWRMALSREARTPHWCNVSDAIPIASRVVTSHVCRRYGLAVTRACYRRLLYAGHDDIREPDEVIQDRNQFPEPLEVFRICPEEHQRIMSGRS